MNKAVGRALAVLPKGELVKRLDLAAAPLAAFCYSFLLMGFHACVLHGGAGLLSIAACLLLAAFAVPGFAIVRAVSLTRLSRPTLAQQRARSLALLSVAAPPLFVLLGVLLYMAQSPVRDTWIWAGFWLAGSLAVAASDANKSAPVARRTLPRWLAPAHGTSALALIVLFLTLHLLNHTSFVFGHDTYMALMHAFRHVYRNAVLQPIVVGLMLFQVGSGLWLLRGFLGRVLDPMKTFQVAAGAYLAAYIPSHLNSVFIFGRRYLGVDTGFDFAVGAPTGLINDSWNIRLVPYYGLGVFFVLSHLAAGVRTVMLANGTSRRAPTARWSRVPRGPDCSWCGSS